MKRRLGSFECAQILSNDHFPFNVVSVLSLDLGPPAAVLNRALTVLRDRHPLLRARVVRESGRFEFRLDRSLPMPLTVVPDPCTEGWREVAERELNTGFDAASGPLHRFTCLLAPDGRVRYLVLSAQHAIFDAVSGSHLLDELLTVCDRLGAGQTPEGFGPLPFKAPAEDYFPARFRGWRGRLGQARFAARQIATESALRWRSRHDPPPAAAARCRIFPVQLGENATAALARRCRRERVTMNSVLCAAQLMAANEHLQGTPELCHFVFADLRPYLVPTLGPENLGSYLAMMRLTTRIEGTDLWALARRVGRQVHAASKRGDKFNSWSLSRTMMQMVLRARNHRMGHAALAYGGGTRLGERHGEIRVTGLNAFVSNFVLGPAFTANARRFLGRLWWDMVYLDSDMDETTAGATAGRVIALLSA